MSTLFAITLITHIVAGVIALGASYAFLLNVVGKDPSLKLLRVSSLTALAGYLLSWLSGGYYYVLYYGGVVKPIIKEGAYPWAHLVFMEGKEHVFLFLPFLAVVLCVLSWSVSKAELADMNIKRATIALAIASVLLGTIITLSGILISGGAR